MNTAIIFILILIRFHPFFYYLHIIIEQLAAFCVIIKNSSPLICIQQLTIKQGVGTDNSRDINIAVNKNRFQTFGKRDRKSTRLNSSHANISYAVFCLKK